ncbi:MAG: HEAT repeat domain-containing protein [Akkermansiaceae bacterium]|nr:HEAT repeat domain-containing protein [Akkermansiaceae bacterium]
MSKFHGVLIGGLAILAITVVFFARTTDVKPTLISSPKSQTTQRADHSTSPANRIPAGRRAADRFTNFPEIPAPVISPHPPGSSENQRWIDERKGQLNDLSWFDDADSLRKILAELQNPLPEIRSAALAAVRDFGSRDAVPYLQAVAAKTKDPGELKSLEEAIEHLETPSILEHLEENITEAE